MSEIKEITSEELLGPLNSVEKKNAPPRLFVSGHREILSDGGRVSIVGSRKASEKGLKLAWNLASKLAKQGFVVVSGLAEGIDSQAHKAAITARGKTIAILGTPLDEFFPAKNKELQRLIMSEYLAISQFPSQSRVFPSNFPQRNRTMALISDATIIVEAAEKSGTEHQGWEALRLGRPLFIMKWLASERKLSWVEKMREYGAQLVDDDSFDDISESVPYRVSSYESQLSL